jgi:hypothetical protein
MPRRFLCPGFHGIMVRMFYLSKWPDNPITPGDGLVGLLCRPRPITPTPAPPSPPPSHRRGGGVPQRRWEKCLPSKKTIHPPSSAPTVVANRSHHAMHQMMWPHLLSPPGRDPAGSDDNKGNFNKCGCARQGQACSKGTDAPAGVGPGLWWDGGRGAVKGGGKAATIIM